jgi:hypothetical protein
MWYRNSKSMFMRIRGRLGFAMVKLILDVPTRFNIGQLILLYMVYGHNTRQADILPHAQLNHLISLFRNKSAKAK